MNEVFVVRLNLLFSNAGVSEMAFPSYSKAANFYNGVLIDLKDDGYVTSDKPVKVNANNIPVRKSVRLERPSKSINGAIETAIVSIKRLAFFD